MSTPAEHPLETLYQAREALQTAVSAVQQQTSEKISDDLGCYGSVNHSILYEFRSLVDVLAEKVRDTNDPLVRVAHAELQETLVLFDQLIALAQYHRPTIKDLLRLAKGLDAGSPTAPHGLAEQAQLQRTPDEDEEGGGPSGVRVPA